MTTKTLDTLVRESLLNAGKSLHYYVPHLHFARQCIENELVRHNIGTNVKEVILPIDSVNEVTIPAGCDSVIGVYGLVGSERRAFHRNTNITTAIKRDDANVIVPYNEDETFLDIPLGSIAKESSTKEEYPTVFYENEGYQYEYNVAGDRGKVIIKEGHKLTEVGLIYLSNTLSKTSANIVNGLATNAILTYIEWKLTVNDPTISQNRRDYLRNEFYNEDRKLAGKVSPISITDIYHDLYG